MASCELCKKMEGDRTSEDDEFYETFNVLECNNTSMTSSGVAECKTCRQKVDFDFDDTLIPKLRVRFLPDDV